WGQRLRPAVAALDHEGYDLTSAELSRDGLSVLTSGADGTNRLWNSLTGKQRVQLNHDGYAIDSAMLSPDGRTVLTTGSDGTARLWDSATGKQRAVLGERRLRFPGIST